MKSKFFLFSSLLIFSRGCDMYSTSLWFSDAPGDETNPLVGVLGFGWNGLVISNVAITVLILWAFYRYSFRYRTPSLEFTSNKLTDFISELYFNEKGKFLQVFYRTPKNKEVLIAHSGYILIRVVIFASLLATAHNLCQFYNVAAYDTFREIVGRPLFVIYGLIFVSLVLNTYILWKRESESVNTGP